MFNYNLNNKYDFVNLEKKLGFIINDNLKDFYNCNLFETISFNIDKSLLNTSFNHGNWFEESDKIICTLYGNKDLKNFSSFLESNFNQNSIYGDEVYKERRYSIGEIEDNRGIMGLYFNNDTGKIEWCDYEWGADKWEDNPRGIICESIKDFLRIIPKQRSFRNNQKFSRYLIKNNLEYKT